MKRLWFVLSCLLIVARPLLATEAPKTAKAPTPSKIETATFAGGCFWCMQPPFDKLKGVISTTVGYAGGKGAKPTYVQVSTGDTGFAEAIEIKYDPTKITYKRLLNVYWMNIDPTVRNRQFADEGTQYRTAIFYHNDEQRKLAEESKKALEKSGRFLGRPIVTEIVPATTFFPAEDYHQEFYMKNSKRYHMYRKASGRDKYLESVWGKEKKNGKSKDKDQKKQ
jgi:methionine-S-sulfoxide reductase